MRLTATETKYLKKLKDKKYRKTEQLFLVEGVKLCEELIKSNFKISRTLATDEKYNNYPNFVLVNHEILDTIATTKTPQDIICVAEIPQKFDGLPKGNSLVLDNLQDPGNIGTLIRSAIAFDFNDIYFINCPDIYSEKVIRGSMGAVFKINPHFVTKEEFIASKSDICDILVGTDLNSSDKLNFSPKSKLAIVIGNEGNGVDKDILKHCDSIVTLKMTDKVESLNAGVAGSITMYEIYKC